ncbi:plasmid stabilization protein [Aquincola sp. S2]|uniref:Plasmid stabilization protein n=1 Tax=Pseudaquabacterium terrae TaxID=2732868 RepID=A0ABX2ERR8_9BURK|nr:StbB family protein [Aquabacterium terrae]NRF71375.1 plasmid stabilization protein [Aquabacterium terrae]
MKVVLINFSGNVGKSTLAAHMLAPRIGDAQIYSVESLNLDAELDGVEVERHRGKRLIELLDEVMSREAAVVDVGASNAEEFMKGMRSLQGAHEEFDWFVVPAVHSRKQLGDTLNTIRALQELGVPRAKVRVVMNRVDEGDSVQVEFGVLFHAAATEGNCVVPPAATVYANEVFERLKGTGLSLAQVHADTTPWRDRFRAATTDEERDHALRMLTLKRLSGSASSNLDHAFGALFA